MLLSPAGDDKELELKDSQSDDDDDTRHELDDEAEKELQSFFASGFTLKKPLDLKLLDDRILKALNKQEERKAKKNARKKDVMKTNDTVSLA